MFPQLNTSKILIHIAFHFVESRIQYLRTVLASINQYRFEQIDVVIDTNSSSTSTHVMQHLDAYNFNLDIHVHKILEHPFLLTWAHRKNIGQSINDYDYFMYIEDDIEIQYDAITRWRDDSIELHPSGFLRGFLRTEVTHDNKTMLTDVRKRLKYQNILFYKNKYYFYPTIPYQGFWIYSQSQMHSFLSSPCWRDGNYPKWEVRERAAAGMIWLNSSSHKVLIPFSDNLNIPDEVLVRHLPNNYANDPNSVLAKIDLNKFTNSKLLIKTYGLVSKYTNKQLI